MPGFASNSQPPTIREHSSEVGSQVRRSGKAIQGNYNFETGAYRRVESPTNVPYEITG